MRHYANKFRTSAHELSNFRNPISTRKTNVKIKKEYSSKFCKYCKKTNHDISKCRKRIFSEKRKIEQNNEASSFNNNNSRTIEDIKSDSNYIRVITPTDKEHTHGNSENFINSQTMF